jgi:hypothetical protein
MFRNTDTVRLYERHLRVFCFHLAFILEPLRLYDWNWPRATLIVKVLLR